MNKPFAFAGKTWQWLQIGQTYELRTGGRAVARVVPDQVYPQMYRVERADKLSDMANLTRAKDAALSLSSGADDRQRRAPMRQNEKGANQQRAPEKLTSDRRRASVNPAHHNKEQRL
jgi:hypothetical protein